MSDRTVAAAAQAMVGLRGRERQARRVFDRSMIPMTLVDNERRNVAANRATRLLFRMSLAEIRGRRIDELTPRYEWATTARAWHEMLSVGFVTGTSSIRFPDGTHLAVVYAAAANLLPGKHLIVSMPAGWPEDELGLPEDWQPQPLSGPLSPREREVLTLIAAGADIEQMAEELTIAPATVRTHIVKILRKLGARNRAHAVAIAMQRGLIGASD